MRILIVEDETNLASVIERGLKGQGYQAFIAESGEDALLLVRTEPVDLVLLDIGLPDRDGHAVLADLRRLRRDLPVIMVTARDDIPSKIGALDQGADDYITKPFNFDELLARIRARLRADRTPEETVLRAGDASLDLRTRRLTVGERTMELSAREFSMAELFFRHPEQVLAREQLLSNVWGYDYDPGSNVVDVYVGYLRKKLGKERIKTLRGIGYRFDPGPAEGEPAP
jgi:DNA-binding response OmpR family regulator